MLDSPSLLAGGQGRGFPRRMSHAASTGGHRLPHMPVMTSLLRFVVDALLHVDRSRGGGKKCLATGERQASLLSLFAHTYLYGKPCRHGLLYVNPT